jgi:L-2-amino-thiazoline-4-carboxylic acid hydrolase-like protein
VTVTAARPAAVGDQVIRVLVFQVARHVLTGRLRDTSDPLRGRLNRHQVHSILGGAQAEFARLARSLPGEPTAGSRLCVRLAAWTLALDRALQAHGVTAADSRTLTADVAWAAYRPFVAASASPARLLVRHPPARLRALARSQQRFPFNPPGWRFSPVGSDGSAVDITHCPIADYLLSQGAAGLCVAAWCGQDGPVAERWGAQLRRTGTLATGAAVCDFRYHIGPTGQPGRRAGSSALPTSRRRPDT